MRRVDCDNNFNKNIIWDWRPGMADKVGPKLESFAPIVHNKPLLIIDDECDSASVDTGVQAINNGTCPGVLKVELKNCFGFSF